MPSRIYKAILFDLDGTLLDTLQDIADSVNTVLKRHNLPTHSNEEYRYFVGEGSETLLSRALPEDSRDKETVKALTQEYRAEYDLRWTNSSKPYPQILDLLHQLEKRDIVTAVLSNKMHSATCQMVKALLPEHNFSYVQGATEELPAKPDPSGAHLIAKELKIAEKNWIYLGDTDIDMLTAKRAGMLPAGVLWGFREADELMQNGAKILLYSPLELIAYL